MTSPLKQIKVELEAALLDVAEAAQAQRRHAELEPMGLGDDGSPETGGAHWPMYLEWERVADRLDASLDAALVRLSAIDSANPQKEAES